MQPYPASERILCQFAAYLGSSNISQKTIKAYLSGIRFHHIVSNLQDPEISGMARLQYVLRGIKMTQAKQGTKAQKKRLPVTPRILLTIHPILSRKQSFDSTMLWAAFLTCFYGFMRAGEVTIPNNSSYDPTVHLNFADLAFNDASNPSMMRVNIKASKTDPFRTGVQIYIGITSNTLCPIKAMLAYLSMRGQHPGLLFHYLSGSPLTKQRFVADFRSSLTEAGLSSSDYAGHSFRIGAATTAAANGIEDSVIQTLGRWKSNAYLLYVKINPQQLAAISSHISK